MDRAEAIEVLKEISATLKSWSGFTKYPQAIDMAIEALKAEPRQHHLGKHADITVIDEVETHDKRTETHECVSETHGDLISRDDAREAIEKLMEIHFDRQVVLAKARDAIVSLPPADTDMSEYSDKLWKAAYERGKADGAEELKYMRQRNAQLETMLHAQMAISGNAVPKSEQYKKGFEDAKRAFLVEYARESKERTGEWIPVSEGLPKVKQEVYVTVYFTEGDYGRAYGYIDGFGKWHLYSTVEGTLNSGYEVTAWMPLPEPYKGGDDK